MSVLVWSTTVGLLCALWLIVAWRRGPQLAIGCQVLVACLVPTWAKLEVTDELWMDCRVTATIFGLLAYCLHPKRTFPLRLGWLDAVMLCLLAVHITSDVLKLAYWPFILLRVYGEWCVPYFAGRLALQSSQDFRQLAPWGIGVAIVLALGSIVEGVTAEHPWELIYGERPLDGIMRDQPRWGITRAWGCCAHPIYFGFLQLMFLPWLLRVWHRSRFVGNDSDNSRSRGRSDSKSKRQAHPNRIYEPANRAVGKRVPAPFSWAWLLPLVGLAGVYCTGSRAPFLGYLLVPFLGLFAFVPKLRVPLAVLVVVVAGLGLWQREKLTKLVTDWGETVNEARTIEIDGKTEQVSGTATRWQLLSVYRRALKDAEWFGFGTDSVSGFPIRVPVGAVDPQLLRTVPYIDNEFVLIALRFGWLGVTAFTVALFTAAGAWFLRSRLSSGSASAVSFYVGGTILAVAAGLLTVWMPHDIGFPLLWWMGAGSMSPTQRKLVDS